MKIGNVFLLSLSPFLVLTQEKETKESQAPAGGIFFVRRWAGNGGLGGGELLLFVGKVKIEGFKHRYFYTIRGGRIDMSARYFSKKLWGRMRYAPTLTDEKGAVSLFIVGRGMGILTRIGFSDMLGR